MDCICAEIRKSTRSITNVYDRLLAPSGIRITQFSVLRALSRLKSATLGELADETALDQTSATRSVSAMEQSGFIERIQHHDPRVKNLRLTPSGKAVLKRAETFWNRAQELMQSEVTPEELQRTLVTLRKIASAAQSELV